MSEQFPASSIRHAALLYGAMLLCALGVAWWLPALRPAFGLPTTPRAWLLGLGAGLGLVLLSWLTERAWPAFDALGNQFAQLLGPVGVGRAFVLAVLSGVGEEALFRGVLQTWLGPVWPTLVFAALHGLGQRRLWPWPLFALLAGAVFAGLTAWTGSLWPACLAHIVVNATNLRRLGLRYHRLCPAEPHA